MGWQLIESQSLSASAASVTFSNIPQTYKSLKLLVSARTEIADNADYASVKPNNTTSNQTWRQLTGNGSAAASSNGTGVFGLLRTTGSTTTSNTFGNSLLELPNYSSTTANKPASGDGVGENNATATFMNLSASLWSDTTAITSLVIAPGGGTNFVFGSTFQLYGLA